MRVNGKPKLTGAERRCLAAFRVAKKKAGTRPSLPEIAIELGTSKQYAAKLMERLLAKGRMEITGTRYRAYREPRREAATA